MKRKWISILSAVLLLASLAAKALETEPLSRSPLGEAAFQARKALSAAYGLTPETIGLFHMELEQDGDTWTVQFFPIGFVPRPLGEYRVTLSADGQPQAYWSHDDVDPEIFGSGSLDSPVWGQAQLLKVLEDRESAVDALSRTNPEWLAEEPYMPEMPPAMESLQENESIWFGQILMDAEPGAEDISREAAIAIAAEAIMEESPLTAQELTAGDILSDFKARDGDNTLWMFSFQPYSRGGGIFQDWGVVIDARTGEILFSNIVSGAEG